MGALAERVAERAGGKPLLWLDHFAYSGRLLAAGRIPWLDAAAFAAWLRTAQRLLRSGVAALPLADFFAAWLDAHPELAAAMAARTRPGFALKTLLAAEEPRALLGEIVRAVRDGHPTLPVALMIPSPGRWLAWAHDLAGAGTIEPAADDVEAAAMYVAGWLRTFAGAGVDALLLEEPPGRGPALAAEVLLHQPVINVAHHYRWDVGIEALGASFVPGPEQGIDFCITDVSAGSGLRGIVLGDAFWAGEPPPPASGACFYFARVPADAVPERVLERLGPLR